jgi:tetratricopeptide (TPR) repeat protein
MKTRLFITGFLLYYFLLSLNGQKIHSLNIDSIKNVIQQHEKTNNTEGWVSATFDLANAQIGVGQVNEAERNYKIVRQKATEYGFNRLAFEVNYALEIIYSLRGDFQNQHQSNLNCLAIAKLLNDSAYLTETYGKLLNEYVKIGNRDSSIFCYKKALQFKNGADSSATKSLYNSISYFHLTNGDYEGALTYRLKSIDLQNPSQNNSPYLSKGYTDLANILFKMTTPKQKCTRKRLMTFACNSIILSAKKVLLRA